MAEPTYIFRDGNVYTMVDGKVVASKKEADSDYTWGDAQRAENQDLGVEMPEPPAEIAPVPCPQCGQPADAQDAFCSTCGSPLGEEATTAPAPSGPGFDEGEPVGDPWMATAKQTVTTPNGLKGRVLARTPELWGDQVTVRWENGNITSIPVDSKLTFEAAEDAPESESPVERLEERLASDVIPEKAELQKRVNELSAIKSEAASLVGKSSDAEAQKLDSISVQADYEIREVQSALEHIAATEAEGFKAPAPIESLPMVEQASTGGSDASWLDQTLSSMVAEANATDYTKLMDEGPEAFVASLDDAQLADAKTVRIMASREIRSHTAGAEEDLRDKYEKVFLHRCEEQRKSRLASRKEEVRKEASSEEPINAPDESLFM